MRITFVIWSVLFLLLANTTISGMAALSSIPVRHSISSRGISLPEFSPVVYSGSVLVHQGSFTDAAVLRDANAFLINEGETQFLYISLGTEPTDDVYITLDVVLPDSIPISGNATGLPPRLQIFPDSMIFVASRWNISQKLQIFALDDSVSYPALQWASVHLQLASSDANYTTDPQAPVSIPLLLFDNDYNLGWIGVSLPNRPTGEDGTQAVFYVALLSHNWPPIGNNLVVQIRSTNFSHGYVSPIGLQMTSVDYRVPEPVTVIPVDDDYADGNTVYNVCVIVGCS